MPRSVVVSVGNSWGRPRPGLVGFLWGIPEVFAGSRSRPFRPFGSSLRGRIRGSARLAGSWYRGYLGCRTRLIPGA